MTRAEREHGDAWTPRPMWARVVCIFTALAPVLAGATVAIGLSSSLPASSSLAVTILRILFVVAASTAVVFAVDRAARRLLPLVALYRLSLVFPDHAPSRFRTALKAGSSRRVERLVDETRRSGLPNDPGEAARRVVELITAIGDHDRRTRGHSERVRLYADLIGEELHLPKPDRQKLQWAALLHDLGKLTVPAEILNKKGKPTSDEWAILRTHPAGGERLVLPLRPFLGSWADAVGGHHEWWNGTGYPRQLRGDQISQSAAIVAVADAYEVMTAVRSYKKSMPASAARGELARGAGTQFSPEVVRAFLCVSLGRLRWVAGPAASLAQIPYIGNAVRFPATVSTAIQGATNVAAAAGPSIAAVMVATTAVATSIAVAPPHHHPQHATTVAFAEASSKKVDDATSATTTTVKSGKGAKVSTAAADTPTSIRSSEDKPAADNASVTPDTLDGTASVDTTPPSTDVVPVVPVVVDPVTVSIGDVSMLEGDSGTRSMAFPVTLSQQVDTTVTVDFAIADATATGGTKPKAGVDYKARTGTLTFDPGSTGLTPIQKSITVVVVGDTDAEPDETLTVTLSNPSAGASIGRGTATGTILNDDGLADGTTVGIGDVSVVPAGNHPVFLSIPVRLSAPCDGAVSVSYTVDDGTATWSDRAKSGGDYGGLRTGELDYEPGTVVQNIQVKIWPATSARPDRSFTITLTAVDGTATIVRAIGTVTLYG